MNELIVQWINQSNNQLSSTLVNKANIDIHLDADADADADADLIVHTVS